MAQKLEEYFEQEFSELKSTDIGYDHLTFSGRGYVF
jgi:hypothetical protein